MSNKRSKKRGLPPGSLVHVGKKKRHEPQITIIDYTKTRLLERVAKNVKECLPFRNKKTITWINIDSVHEQAIIAELGKQFDFHPLILEDIMNTEQRPKLEEFKGHVFAVLKMLHYNAAKQKLSIEQVSLILGENYVLSFQEEKGDVFDPIRDRIHNAKGQIRSHGADYLAYALLDAIVDNYFIILEEISERIEILEGEVLRNPSHKTMQSVHSLKRDLIILRKSIWPLREVIKGLELSHATVIKEHTRLYLRDVYDHTIQVIDNIETYREMVSGLMDTYLSTLSNKMNEVMKVLTVIGTIFIPLTFITGIYGMNFRVMPEIDWRFGYHFTWAIMIGIAITMLFYFRKKRWL